MEPPLLSRHRGGCVAGIWLAVVVAVALLVLVTGPPLRAQASAAEVAPPRAEPAQAEPQEPAQEEEIPVETVELPVEVLAGEEPEEAPIRPGALGGAPGPLVERIEVRSDAPIDDTRELRQLITIAVGEPLTELAVRQTLRNLQATGDAYEVEIYTRPVAPEPAGPARAVVVLVIRAAVRIADVAVEGELGLDRRTLEDRVLVTAGEPLIESRVLRSIYRLQELYERRGYFDAGVRLAIDMDDERKLAHVRLRVDSGTRFEIDTVRFEGDTGPFSQETLLSQIRSTPGKAYRRETVRDDSDRLKDWLVAQKHRKAEVDAPREEVDEQAMRVSLVFPVRAGPRVEVEILGVEAKELRKAELLPFLDEEGYDEALVIQAVDRVRRYFQERGHWQVVVDYHEERQDDMVRLVFEVEPGPVYTLETVRFEGNHQVADAQLSQLMETAPRRLLTLGSGRLVTAVLEEDLENIRSYYALQGYVGSRVGPAETRADGRSIELTIPIEEGRRRQVVNLLFEGMEKLSPGTIRAELPLQSGGPYHPLLLEDSLREIRGLYEERGYANAQVSAREDWNEAGSLVDVTVEVIEGPRTVVDRVIVRGNYRTADDIVFRAVDLAPGDAVSRSRLLEVERRLYGLGIFSRVQVELGPADLSERARDVIVRVEEGRTQRLSYGLGYSTDVGPAALFGYSHKNLRGRAVTLQTDLRYGEKERLARAVIDQPGVFRWRIPLLYTLAYQEEERSSYDVDRVVGQVEASRQIGRWRYGLAFDYRIVSSALTVESGNPEQVDDGPGLIERRDQDAQVSSVIPNILVDYRNDPIEPTAGWSSVARVQYSFPITGLTDADFVKIFVQHTHYKELPFGHLAGSLRLGLIEPLVDVTEDPEAEPGIEVPEEPENLKIPIDERFFAGGDYSHRAYYRDDLGIPGETLFGNGDGRGGNGLVLFNLDYRFPIWGDLGGVAFYDLGNVWPDWREVDPTGLKAGIGLGVRYSSPIGPIRAGIAYKLNPESSLEEDRWRFFLAIGNPF